jgi:hypothetical protein
MHEYITVLLPVKIMFANKKSFKPINHASVMQTHSGAYLDEPAAERSPILIILILSFCIEHRKGINQHKPRYVNKPLDHTRIDGDGMHPPMNLGVLICQLPLL